MTQDLHHLAAAYALDALEPDERAAFEAHYPSCEICSREVVEFRQTAAVLAAQTATPPPADLRAAVMAEVGRTRQLSPSRSAAVELDRQRARRRRVSRVIGAAAAALVLVVGTAVIVDDGQDRIGDVVAATDAQFVTLEGGDGRIEAVWSDDLDRVVLRASGLAHPGDGRAYALWSLRAGVAVPAGLFTPADDGSLTVLLDVDQLDPDQWGVTIEPEGGSAQPTGEVLFVGEVSA